MRGGGRGSRRGGAQKRSAWLRGYVGEEVAMSGLQLYVRTCSRIPLFRSDAPNPGSQTKPTVTADQNPL